MKKKRIRLLCIELGKVNSESRPNFHAQLDPQKCSYAVYGLNAHRSWLIFLRIIFMPLRLSKYDCIITSSYWSSYGVSTRLLLTGSRTKHLTIGLNQSSRLLKSGIAWVDRIINRPFQRGDVYLVHSRAEAELFELNHAIARNKFHFCHWGYDLPQTVPGRFAEWSRPYVCLVGRNNRDIETFAKAMSKLDLDGIIITMRKFSPQYTLPSNVHIFFDLPSEDALDCIKGAMANIVLVKDDLRGAGHITAVSAMLAGVPQVVSDVAVLRDYFIDGYNAFLVPLGDPQSVSQAIQRLADDEALRTRIGQNGKRYAYRWLLNDRVAERFVKIFHMLVNDKPIPFVDEEWRKEFDRLVEQARSK